jgi:hypothetical protein
MEGHTGEKTKNSRFW